MALNDLELFNRNEHLVLLDSLKHQRISKEQELVLELEKITTSQGKFHTSHSLIDKLISDYYCIFTIPLIGSIKRFYHHMLNKRAEL